MKILIIGSKGFIGSHLVSYFTKRKVDVWQCDVIVDYTLPKYFLIDATNSDFLSVFESQQFDVCINCSGAASVPDSLINPLRDFYLNTSTVFNILNAISKYNAECKFINFSSAAVYGNPKKLPILESEELNPVSPYGTHKLMSEIICKEFNREFKIKTCSLRVFSAYGQGLKKQLFWDMYKKTNNSNNLELFGSGYETRDFIHIDDIAQIVELLIKKGDFVGEAINVANGVEVSIKNAVEEFIKQLKWCGKVVFSGKERLGDPINWRADISIIKSMGYKQTITLENGLNKYIEWLKGKN